MKKYIAVASLFALNNEVISWIALTIIAFMALVAFLKGMEKGGFFK